MRSDVSCLSEAPKSLSLSYSCSSCFSCARFSLKLTSCRIASFFSHSLKMLSKLFTFSSPMLRM